MAITKVFAIRSRFEKTVQYAANEEKTSLSGMIEYAVNPDKTEKRLFESCLNCVSVENAARDMERTKRRYNKSGGRAIISFSLFSRGSLPRSRPTPSV